MSSHCENCRWWELRTFTAGSCRRHSPLITGGLYSPTETAWPVTAPADWCGDFEKTVRPEFAEVMNDDLSQAPTDGTTIIAKLEDGREQAVVWWRNWPGWREAFAGGTVGGPATPIAWRPCTASEQLDCDIPF